MPASLRDAFRVARKEHVCDMCSGAIRVGDRHHVATNVFDGRVYDWRTCSACARDHITSLVYDWAGWPEDGVGYDNGLEWADDVINGAAKDATEEVAAARAFLARARDPDHAKPGETNGDDDAQD